MRNLTRAILVILALGLVAPAFAADGGAAAPAPAAPAAKAPAAAPAPAAAAAAAPAAADTTPAVKAPEAAAQAAEAQAWWQVLLAELLKVFLVICVPVLATFLTSLLRRWKINVEYQQVASIATKAADWAEHKALAALKEGRPKTPGGEKMKLAMDFANGLAAQYKLPDKATAKLQGLIESALEKEEKPKAAELAAKPAEG